MALSYPAFFDYVILDGAGKPAVGAELTAYYSGTNNPAAIYNSSGAEIAQPLVVGSDGRVDFRLSDAFAYRIKVVGPLGELIVQKDNVSGGGSGGGGAVPSGGTTGQQLAKLSDDDFDVTWVNPTVLDYKVKTDGLDGTQGYLDDKILVDGQITKTIVNGGASRKVQIGVDLSGYVPYVGATDDVDLGANDLKTMVVRNSGAGTMGMVNNSGGISHEATTFWQAAIGGAVKLAQTSSLLQTYTNVAPSDNNLKDLGTVSGRYRRVYVGDLLEVKHPSGNAQGIGTYSAPAAGNTAPPLVTGIGTQPLVKAYSTSSGVEARGLVELYEYNGSVSTKTVEMDSQALRQQSMATDMGVGGLGGAWYIKNNQPWFSDGTTPKKLLREGDVPPSAACLTTIKYGLSGVVAAAQGTKHELSFASTNGWYLPDGVTATLKGIGMKTRSLTSTVLGQTLKVQLKSYAPSNVAQRAYGDGTLVGAEYTVYTSDFAGATKWDGCGEITGLDVSLTDGMVYYLDISQISISCDDLLLTLYVELT